MRRCRSSSPAQRTPQASTSWIRLARSDNYSNPNFYLAGLALERASGVTYRQAIALQPRGPPLGMERTFFLPSEVIADGNFSDGASTNEAGGPWDVTPDAYDNAWLRPAGYAFSSVVDYAKFVQFLYAGNQSVLSDTERQAMQTAQVNMLDSSAAWPLTSRATASAWSSIASSSWGPMPERDQARLAQRKSSRVHELVLSRPVDRVRNRLARECRRRELREFGRSRAGELRRADESHDDDAGGYRGRPDPLPALRRNLQRPQRDGSHHRDGQRGDPFGRRSDDDAAGTSYSQTLQPTSMDNFTITVEGTTIPVTFIADATGAYVWIRTREVVAQRVPGDATP